ncbi:MAG: SulP family inorganic anion transporter [Cyclobacteriaceae bacterium]|nr:SulP family inorganic anion transporter [Cyclobacteriaceae bacterium]
MAFNQIKVFPMTQWLSVYSLGKARWDIIAGITLASFVLPESMAYASLAGVPSQYGIYCCIAGCLFFALFTQSRQVAVGPTSAISLMVGTTVAVMSGGNLERWAAIASLTAFAVFLFCLTAYFLKLSSLVNFISENILLGFKAGAALTIGVTQLPKLFGVEGGGHNFFERITILVSHLPETHTNILWFGLAALALLIAGNHFLPGRPVSLVVVIVSIAVVSFFPESFNQLHLTGEIPSGLPSVGRPSLRMVDVDGILGLAMGIFLMGYIETMAVARTFAEKNGYSVDPRQELLSLGAANFGAAFFSGYPVSGGMSQSTVNDKAGARTPMALLICSATLCILLLFFTGLLRNLPEVILAVVVLDAVSGLIKVKELKIVYRLDRREFYIAMLAVVAVLVFGILKGVLLTAVASLLLIIARTSSPAVVLLGRVPGTLQYSDIERHPDNESIAHTKIIRVESSIFYFNQQFVFDRISDLVGKDNGTRLLVLDLSASPMVDVSGSAMLTKLQQWLNERNIDLRIVNALSHVRELLRKRGLENAVGHISRRVSIQQTIDDYFESPANS